MARGGIESQAAPPPKPPPTAPATPRTTASTPTSATRRVALAGGRVRPDSRRGSRELTEQGRRREPRAIERGRSRRGARPTSSRAPPTSTAATLLCALANQLPEGAERRSARQAVDRLLASERVICVHRAARPARPATSRRRGSWELEQRLHRDRRALERTPGAGSSTTSPLAAVLERHPYLSAEQAEMVRRLDERRRADRRRSRRCPAPARRRRWRPPGRLGRRPGYPVIGVATARSASGELSDAGVPATSIAALLSRAERRPERGRSPRPRHRDRRWTRPRPPRPRDAAALAELAEELRGQARRDRRPAPDRRRRPRRPLRPPDRRDRALDPSDRDPPPARSARPPRRRARPRGPRLGRARPAAQRGAA